ncbi:VOC family protein [Micromonospora sp. NPDC049559]|uniref:VOC family protein n=1 Tax=Micromonospora sp. NPDC049559 TaxID=3155923 RepID=UPI00342C1C43
MTSRIAQWTLDVRDVERMAEFWSAVLGYRIDQGDDGSAKLYPPADAPAGTPTVWLQHAETPKRGKNRNHPDLNVTGDDPDREVERLLALGARHVDVGQTERDPFVVLADPEGNEFCVLREPVRGGPETA